LLMEHESILYQASLTQKCSPCILLFTDFHQDYFRFYNERASDIEAIVKLKHKLHQKSKNLRLTNPLPTRTQKP